MKKLSQRIIFQIQFRVAESRLISDTQLVAMLRCNNTPFRHDACRVFALVVQTVIMRDVSIFFYRGVSLIRNGNMRIKTAYFI